MDDLYPEDDNDDVFQDIQRADLDELPDTTAVLTQVAATLRNQYYNYDGMSSGTQTSLPDTAREENALSPEYYEDFGDFDDEDYDELQTRSETLSPDGVSSYSYTNNDVPNSLLIVHTVNTLNIMKRYMPFKTDELPECQFNPQEHDYFDFADIHANPLDSLDPKEFDCRTAVIIVVGDRQTYADLGSPWTCLLLEELRAKNLFPMCFTLMNQENVKTIETMLGDLPESIKTNLDLENKMDELERFVTMSTLSRILRYWSVPILVIDSGPKHMLDYPSIFKFAQRANIKLIKFGASKTASRDIEKIQSKCKIKAAESLKAIDEAFTQEFKRKWEQGFVSMQSLRCVKDFEKVLQEAFRKQDVPQIMKEEILRQYHAPQPLMGIISPFGQVVEMHSISIAVPEALLDLNEWLQWEQPYYDRKQEERKNEQRKREKIENKLNSTKQIDEIVPDDGNEDWESLSESEDSNDIGLQRRSGLKCYLRRHNSEDINNNNDNNEKDSCLGRTTINTEEIFGNEVLQKLTHGFDKKELNEPNGQILNSSSAETSDFEDMEFLMEDHHGFKFVRPIKKEFLTMQPILEEVYKHTINSPIKSLRNEPKVDDDMNISRGYTKGRSSCLPIKPDEMEIYKNPIHFVLTPYEIEYLNRKMVTTKVSYASSFVAWVIRESTELFIDTIIYVCCGSRPLPGPLHVRERVKTIVFINDNNDALELLTNALWFCGKTALCTVQSQYYTEEQHFKQSLDACKDYAKHSSTSVEEDLYLEWLGIGMNQIMKDNETRFLIVDFPRPGKQLNKTFETVVKRLQMEHHYKGISTIYISKSGCRADTLATVERALDHIQAIMCPKERIVFRKTRKIYLDAKLYHDYEQECKDDETRKKEWGLPQTDGRKFWEQLHLKEFQFFTKSTATSVPIISPAVVEIRGGEDLVSDIAEGTYDNRFVPLGEDDSIDLEEGNDDEEDDFDALFEESPPSFSDTDSEIKIDTVSEHSENPDRKNQEIHQQLVQTLPAVRDLVQELIVNASIVPHFQDSPQEVNFIIERSSNFVSFEESVSCPYYKHSTQPVYAAIGEENNADLLEFLKPPRLTENTESDSEDEDGERGLSLRRCEGVMNLVDHDIFKDDSSIDDEVTKILKISEEVETLNIISETLPENNNEEVKTGIRKVSNEYLKFIGQVFSEVFEQLIQTRNRRQVHPTNSTTDVNVDWETVDEDIVHEVTPTPQCSPRIDNNLEITTLNIPILISPAVSELAFLPIQKSPLMVQNTELPESYNPSVHSVNSKKSMESEDIYEPLTSITCPFEYQSDSTFDIYSEPTVQVKDNNKSEVDSSNSRALSVTKRFRSSLATVSPETLISSTQTNKENGRTSWLIDTIFLKPYRTIYSCCLGLGITKENEN